MPTMESVIGRNQIITEQRILHPVTQVFEDVTAKAIVPKPLIITQSTAKTIQELFPEQEYEEKNIQRAKEVLGELSKQFSKTEMRDLVAQVEYLAESWLDEFERDIFSGKTLNELLHERGGL